MAGVQQKVPQILVWLAALVAGLVTLISMRGPAPLPADAPADIFSARRAWRHVEAIAREPHPLGTPAHAAVRDYLLTELRQLGLEPTQQSTTFTQNRDGRSFPVENVLARLTGTTSEPAILLTAHYDSVPGGPGAADDASGVAALLETLRILQQSPALRRSIVALFSDGEEAGLFGARAFVDSGIATEEIALVLNFEARGNAGPSFMFETSPENRALVAAFARAAPHPIATSVSGMVYRRMPNDTDFTIYRRAGIAGLNFAFIDGVEHYHRPTDTPANLDLRSLQHTGETALALARYWGYADELPRVAGDAVYFNLGGSFLVHYPVAWARPGALVLTVFAVAVLLRGRKRGMFAGKHLWRSATWVVGGLFVVVMWAALNFWIARILGRDWWGYSYVAGLLAGVAVTWSVGGIAFRANGWAAAAAATFLVWLVMSVVLAFLLPEASYVTFWPTAAGWLGLAVLTIGPARAHVAILPLMAFAAVLTAVMLAPLLYYAFVSLPVAMPGLVVLAGLGASLVSVAAQATGWRGATV